MKNMWDIVLDNYLDIYLFEDQTKKSDDEKKIEDFEKYKNRKIKEKETIKKKLEIIEKKIKIILSDEKSKKAREIKNKLMFMISYASNYLTFNIFDYPNFMMNNWNKKDFFGSVKKDDEKFYDGFVKTNLDIKVFNKEFLISKFVIENEYFYIDSENTNNFFSYLFKNIYWLRSAIKNKVQNEAQVINNNASIVTALITLLIINGYFSNIVFNKISHEFKNYFDIQTNININELVILNDIKKSFISKSRNYKNKNNINIFLEYDSKKFSEIIIDFEKQFNIFEYKDLLEKNDERFKLSQFKNKYSRFFYNWNNLIFNIENYLFNDLNFLIKDDNKISFNKQWINDSNDELQKKLENQFKILEIIIKGNKHKGIYIYDNKIFKNEQKILSELITKENYSKLNFLNIYNLTINFLITLRNELKQIKVDRWIYVDNNYFYGKKISGKEEKNKSKIDLKIMHKGFVISNINRLIKNFNQFLSNQANEISYFTINKTVSKNEKHLTLINSGNFSEKNYERHNRFIKINKKIDFNENYLKNMISFQNKINEILNLKGNEKRKSSLEKICKEDNLNLNNSLFKFKFYAEKKIRIQYIKTITVNNILKNEDELFYFIKNEIKINKLDLFIYYKNILNKNILNENTFTRKDLNILLDKKVIRENIKYLIYDKESIKVAKYDNKDKEKSNLMIHNFFTKIIKIKLLKYNTFEEYKKELTEDYRKIGLKLNDDNPNLKIYEELNKIKNTHKNEDELITVLRNLYKIIVIKYHQNKENIVFYTYVKKYVLNLYSKKLFKESIIHTLNITKGEAINTILEKFPELQKNIGEKKDKKGNPKFYLKNFNYSWGEWSNFFVEKIKKNNEEIQYLLFTSFGKLKDYSIKYKIKSEILEFDENSIFNKKINATNNKNKLELKKNDVYELMILLKKSRLINKYPLIYYNLFYSYKNAKEEIITLNNIEVKPKNYKIFVIYNPIDVIYKKTKIKNLSEISINSPLLFNELKNMGSNKLQLANFKKRKNNKILTQKTHSENKNYNKYI